MAKFCSNCGKPLVEDAAFCADCGTAVPVDRIDTAVIPEEAPVPAAETAVEVIPVKKPSAPPVSAHAPDAIKPNDPIQSTIDTMKANPKKLILPCAILAGALILVILLSSLLGGGGGNYTVAIDNYMDLMTGDASVLEDLAPKGFWSYTEENMGISLKELKEQFKSVSSMMESSMEAQVGKNPKISYKILEEEALDKDILKQLEDAINNDYGMNAKVSAGYNLNVELTLKGSEGKESNTTDLQVLKVDGKWYVVAIRKYDDTYSVEFVDF